jgi:D-alanine-D-alanine ligase
VHKDLIPPTEVNSQIDRTQTPWITEHDVYKTLTKMGHEVKIVGLINQIERLINIIKEFNPHCVFNLLEEFDYDTQSDYKVIALLDMLNIKYSGCNPKGLLLARDKALSKKILKHHRIGTPNFFTLKKNKKIRIPKKVKYPLIVKCLFEEASYGIAKASVVQNEEKLIERVKYIHEKLDQDVILEDFIAGREIYIGVVGNIKLTHFTPWELKFKNSNEPDKEIYSQQAKWNEKYRKRKGIDSCAADLSPELEAKIIKTVKKTYQVLNLNGYARIDLRIDNNDKVFVLEANPNPNIAKDDEFAMSAQKSGVNYEDLLHLLLPS